jgi:hypothetical protein
LLYFSEINDNYENNKEYLDSIKYVDIVISNIDSIVRGAHNEDDNQEWFDECSNVSSIYL